MFEKYEYHGPWTELAAAIVSQACKDYVHGLIGRHKFPEKECYVREIQECEAFFHSAWYETLCDIDSEHLMTRLRRTAAATSKKTEVA